MRLAGGGKPYRGRLEIFVRGSWGTVCDDGFGANEAVVACRQLGYDGSTSYSAKYPSGTGQIWMDDVNCADKKKRALDGEKTKGTSRLADCKKRYTSSPFCQGGHWGDHNCNHNEDVGIICSTSGKCSIRGSGNIPPYLKGVDIFFLICTPRQVRGILPSNAIV